MTDYSFTPLHILLVEDNADDALLLRKTLSRVPGAAFEWTEAPTLRLAIEGLAERSFDAILLDLGLPDSRGIDTFREVFGKAPDTPIVVMTGLDDESLALAAVRQGAQDYLVKGEAEPPLISRSLRYAVERAINEKALRDAREQLEGQSRELAAANRRLEVYARLVDQSPDLMCVIDRQGVYRMVNPTFERLHYDRVESGMVGRSYAEVLGPESAEVIRPNLERAFAGGNVQFSEWFPYPGLGWRYMDVRYYPLPGEDGQMELVAVHIRDATERKRAEEQLAAMRETAERRAAEAEEGQRILEALMDNIPEGIAIADALDGSVRLVSRYGRSFATHPDRPGAIPLNEYLNEWRRFFPDGRPVTDLADLPLTRAIQRGEVVRDEEWILEAPNGVRTPISCAAAPIHDREGRITGAVAAWRDISALKQAEAERERLLEDLRMARDQLEARVRERTDQLSKAVERLRQEVAERRKAQESLAEQSRILEAFFVGTQAPLVFLDKEFNFIRVNAAYARACQRAIDDFAGHNHFVDYPSEELREKFQRVVETKESYQVHARPFVFPDHPDWGTSYWDLSVVPILDAAGEVDFLVFSLLDVTERERADQELRALHREIADLSAREQWRIGQELHDNLGQQLTGVALMAQSLCQKLEERALPEAEVAAQLVACFRNSQNVVSALARGLAPVQIDSKGLMSALEELATQTAQLSGVECRFACEHPVEFNDQNTATHLYRIAQEAVRNAVRHANPRQVAVDLGLDETGRIRLQVQDDGMGIPPDISDSVGMGLRIMRYRAEIIGASLALAPGEEGGTRVTCVLAMPEDSSRSVPSGERSPWRPKTAKKKRAS